VADLLVAGVEDQVRRLAQGAGPPLLQLLVERLRRPADLGGGDLQPAEPLGDGGDLAGRDALDVHLGHGQLQRPLAAEPLLQGRGVELDAPCLGHGQRERPDPCLDGLGLEAVGVPLAVVAALIGPGPEHGGPLQLHDLVEQDPEGVGQAIESLLGQELADLVEGGSLREVGHRRSISLGWLAPSKGPAVARRFKPNPRHRRRGIYRNKDALSP